MIHSLQKNENEKATFEQRLPITLPQFIEGGAHYPISCSFYCTWAIALVITFAGWNKTPNISKADM
jgi:hypothetical protein